VLSDVTIPYTSGYTIKIGTDVNISWHAAPPWYTRYVAKWLTAANDNWTVFVSAVLNWQFQQAMT